MPLWHLFNCYETGRNEANRIETFANGSRDPISIIEANSGASVAWIRASQIGPFDRIVSYEIELQMPKVWPPKALKSWPLNYLKFTPGPRHYLG